MYPIDTVTDCDIDGLACFAEPGTVLLYTTKDKAIPTLQICQDAKRRLFESDNIVTATPLPGCEVARVPVLNHQKSSSLPKE